MANTFKLKTKAGVTTLATVYTVPSSTTAIVLGMMIGNKEYWGKGIGTEVVKLGLEFAFRNLKVHKVYLDVREDNRGAIKIYEKNGFYHEGILKEHVFKNERYYDLVLMSAINPY